MHPQPHVKCLTLEWQCICSAVMSLITISSGNSLPLSTICSAPESALPCYEHLL